MSDNQKNFVVVEGRAYEVVEDLGSQDGGDRVKMVLVGNDTRAVIKKRGLTGWKFYTPIVLPYPKVTGTDA